MRLIDCKSFNGRCITSYLQKARIEDAYMLDKTHATNQAAHEQFYYEIANPIMSHTAAHSVLTAGHVTVRQDGIASTTLDSPKFVIVYLIL